MNEVSAINDGNLFSRWLVACASLELFFSLDLDAKTKFRNSAPSIDRATGSPSKTMAQCALEDTSIQKDCHLCR